MIPQNLSNVYEDLHYVRNAVTRHDEQPPPVYSQVMCSPTGVIFP